MGKRSILVCNTMKSQKTTLNAPVCALPKKSINRGQEGLTKFYSMSEEFSRDRTGSTPDQKSLHFSRGRIVTISPVGAGSKTQRTETWIRKRE